METPKRSFPKIAGTQRTLHAEDTLHRVHEAARTLGVTRLADITGLDHVGIPTYNAVVPASADAISVYTGKGLRPVDAKVGALMEAIERQTILIATSWCPPNLPGTCGTRSPTPRASNIALQTAWLQETSGRKPFVKLSAN